MPYVMVPVPEEHVDEVMQYVLRAIARASAEDWDAESVSQLFLDVDEPSRALLSVVARATVSGKDLGEGDAGRLIELSAREALAIARELNETARELNRPGLIVPRMVSEPAPGGRTRQKRILSMSAEVAMLVQEAERAELQAETTSSGGTG